MTAHLNVLQNGLLLAQQTADPAAPNPLMTFAPFILIFAAMYFLMIAPQNKKRKEHEKMIKSLKAGDEVMTAAGIYGKVTSVKDDRITVAAGDSTKFEMNPSFVQQKIVRDSSKK